MPKLICPIDQRLCLKYLQSSLRRTHLGIRCGCFLHRGSDWTMGVRIGHRVTNFLHNNGSPVSIDSQKSPPSSFAPVSPSCLVC